MCAVFDVRAPVECIKNDFLLSKKQNLSLYPTPQGLKVITFFFLIAVSNP
jgi:hypothetical protein